MSALSILPLSYDIQFILMKAAEAGVTNHFGYVIEPDGIHFRYRGNDFDAVQSVINSYSVSYANEVLRDRMKNEVTKLRWENQQVVPNFDGNGTSIPSDDITASRVIAALEVMDRNPDLPRTRNWKVSDGQWTILSYDIINMMGRAIGVHVQDCFDHERTLHEAIDAAADIYALAEIDIESGWPV